MLILFFKTGKRQENTTMTGAIEGRPEAKESKSCLLCFIPSKAIQNCSPFDAEVADENKQK